MAKKRKQKEEVEEKHGKPWKNVARYDNFCDADKKRAKLLSESDKFQVKVKRCGIGGISYVVKTRKNPLYEENNNKNKKG